MADEIINRVAKSKLVVFDLEEYYPKGKRTLFDIKDWLYEGFVLREKEFRAFVKDYDWAQHQDEYVALYCSSDAIVPAWAYMLVTFSLEPYVKQTALGDLNALETELYQEIIKEIDVETFRDQPIIIKGCSKKPVPTAAYIMLSQALKPVAKSILFGEACSSVPLYKRK